MGSRSKIRRVSLALSVLTGACFTTQVWAEPAAAYDPLETVNRAVFGFNTALAGMMAPVAETYRSSVPVTVQTAAGNVVANVGEPVTAVSSGLAGDWANAGTSAGRFALNTTFGIAGMLDVATPLGFVSRPEDVGSALCAHGVPDGPYLVLPFFGAATARDMMGQVATIGAAVALVGHGAAGAYIVANGLFGFIAEAPVPDVMAADAYSEHRRATIRQRAELCGDEAPETTPDLLPPRLVSDADEA